MNKSSHPHGHNCPPLATWPLNQNWLANLIVSTHTTPCSLFDGGRLCIESIELDFLLIQHCALIRDKTGVGVHLHHFYYVTTEGFSIISSIGIMLLIYILVILFTRKPMHTWPGEDENWKEFSGLLLFPEIPEFLQFGPQMGHPRDSSRSDEKKREGLALGQQKVYVYLINRI